MSGKNGGNSWRSVFLMWYINSFHIQILIIELLFCIRLPKRRWFWQRLLTASAVYLALPAVVPGDYFASFLSIGWFTFGFLVMLVLSGGLLWLCFRINVRQLIFYCCIAHTLQHMVHCLYRITCLAFCLLCGWTDFPAALSGRHLRNCGKNAPQPLWRKRDCRYAE